ncbi:complex I NDUFA9 subunit family protein [Sphingomonas sp.]|uniref:complex I NDUFA9 subunit family protein n=1 Tax=Sphingomonas sp. TaxID=28214 RepID=UPI00286D7B7C|nr:complex I NDUFA9 subunit family protein [Sphingomonas sp.]
MIDPAQQTVTVFGGGGFIGRYVCELLLQRGARVVVACREPRHANFIQPLGGVGRVGFVRADLTLPASVVHAVDGASAVINLVGILKGKFHGIQVEGARTAAEAARRGGAQAFVQVSAIGADAGSESAYGKSKGEGEAAVRAAFPDATIIRPSLVFGPEDALSNRLAGLARLPLLPVIAAQRKFQPVFVRDLALAIAKAAIEPETYGGKTYEIGGPQVMSFRELHEAILTASGQTAELIDLPDFAGSLLSRFGFLPGAPLTRDQWLMLQRDNVAAPGSPGLEAFGIIPTPFAAVAPGWLARFAGSRFGRRSDASAA